MYRSFCRYFLLVSGLILMLVSCDVGNDKNTTETSNSSNPDLCAPAPIQPSGGIIAYANWQAQNLRLQLIGKRVNVGKSDTKFEIMDTRLLLMKQDASCVFSQVHIGELTRLLSEKGEKSESKESIPLDLPIESLGVLEGNSIPIVAFEKIQLIEDTFLIFIYHRREVKWGLTEYYATLVTINAQHMVAGDRVLIGRDAMQPPVYYGDFKVIDKDGISQLVLTRTGEGSFVNEVVFSKDTFGAFREIAGSQSRESVPHTVTDSKGNSKEHALKECGPQGVQYALSKHTCNNNTKPVVERKGSIGRAADGHFIDEYSVSCPDTPPSIKLYYVDAYHCHRQMSD